MVVFPEPPFSFPTTMTWGEPRSCCIAFMGAFNMTAPRHHRLCENRLALGGRRYAAVLRQRSSAQHRDSTFVPTVAGCCTNASCGQLLLREHRGDARYISAQASVAESFGLKMFRNPPVGWAMRA